MGVVVERPPWYNDPRSCAVRANGIQAGATCGLFAVNHALALLPLCPVLSRTEFERIGLSARSGDAAANLIQPGGSNCDFAVLQANLFRHGIRSFPMTAAELQGEDGAAAMVVGDRFSDPFADYVLQDEGAFQTLGYLLRLPSYGGHWVSLLSSSIAPPSRLVGAVPNCVAYLCDSMHPAPFGVSTDEVGELLLACAFEAARGADADLRTFRPDWCCFLLGVALHQ